MIVAEFNIPAFDCRVGTRSEMYGRVTNPSDIHIFSRCGPMVPGGNKTHSDWYLVNGDRSRVGLGQTGKKYCFQPEVSICSRSIENP